MTSNFKLWVLLTVVILLSSFAANYACFSAKPIEGFIVAVSLFETVVLSLLSFMGIAITK
jgi:hypothetical protein